jgi:hypothetical protein
MVTSTKTRHHFAHFLFFACRVSRLGCAALLCCCEQFELLAFQCGSDLNALSPENLSKTFASINSKGDGKLTFDDFYKWLKSGQDLKGGAKGANLGLLRLKLQSKAWAKRMDQAKSDKKAADAKSAAASTKDAKADAKAPAKAEAKKDRKMSKYAVHSPPALSKLLQCTALHSLVLWRAASR